MLYTKKGDNGTTKLFNCPRGVRLSKSEPVFEALGTVDELNSMLGYAKVLARNGKKTLFMKMVKVPYEEILEKIQQALFSVQAELGGSKVYIKKENVLYLEAVVFEVETVLPPIN
jgi:cob(I)alamin adenosyltransferase